jgi:hypothetical protein
MLLHLTMHHQSPRSICLARRGDTKVLQFTKYQCKCAMVEKIEPKKAYTCRHQHGRDFSMSIYTQTYLLQINSCTKQLLYSVRYLWNIDNYYMSTTEQLWHESTLTNYPKKVMDYRTRNQKNKITEPPDTQTVYSFFSNSVYIFSVTSCEI